MKRRVLIFALAVGGILLLLRFPPWDPLFWGAEAAGTGAGLQPRGIEFDPASLPLFLSITLGLGDPEPTAWDGAAHLDRGEFLGIQGWNFTSGEAVHGPTVSWRVGSKPPNYDTRHEPAGEPPREGRRRPPFGTSPTRPVGIWLQLQAPPDALLQVNTRQGSFQFPLQEVLQQGSLRLLEGRVQVERALPTLPVAQTPAQEDYPSLAAGPGGRLYACWIAYQEGRDLLYWSQLEREGWCAPQRLETGSRVLGSTAAVADGQGRVWVIYNALEEGQFDLWARQIVPRQTEAIRLTRHPGNDLNFQAGRDPQGRVWLVWQGLREGKSDIFAMRGNGFDPPPREIRVTKDPANDWDPTLAVDSSGRAVVVWDSYRNGDYDIYMRSLSAEGELGEVIPVTATVSYEVHASALFDRQDRLWVAWEQSGPRWGKDTGQESVQEGTMLHSYRELGIRCWDNGRWLEPPSLEAGFSRLPSNFQELPRFVRDAQGRIWLLFRQWVSRQNPNEVWNIYAVYFDGDRWSEPQKLPRSDGRLKQDFPAVALPDGSVWVLYATDFRGTGTGRNRQWDLFSARLEAEGEVNSFALHPVPASLPSTRYVATPNKGYSTEVGGEKYYLVYGDLHRHTDIRGHGGTDPSIADQYRYAYDAAELDFMATTDHNLVTGDDWSDGLDEYGWWRTQKNADLYLFPGRFVSLFAYERSFTSPGGHRNIVWPDRSGELIPGDRRIPAENIPLGLWRRLKQSGGISIPHTMADKNQPNVSWEWHDPESQPVMEMYQGARASYEYAGAPPEESRGYFAMDEPGHFLWDALARGHRIGVIASSDHGSTHLSYAGVYATELSRKAIFEGLKKRRTLAATDNIVIDFRVGEAFIGEETTVSDPPRLEVRVQGTGSIRRIDLVRDNRFIYTLRPGTSASRFVYSDATLSRGMSGYYYVRVIQEDEMMAWSSAIWVTRR